MDVGARLVVDVPAIVDVVKVVPEPELCQNQMGNKAFGIGKLPAPGMHCE